MTYQQSLEMIEKLKNTVWPYAAEWFVFFDFKTKLDYEVIYFKDTHDHQPELNKYMQIKADTKLPIAHISKELEKTLLYYDDQNVTYLCNLLTGEIMWHDVNNLLRPCSINLALEMIRLSSELENMRHKKSG